MAGAAATGMYQSSPDITALGTAYDDFVARLRRVGPEASRRGRDIAIVPELPRTGTGKITINAQRNADKPAVIIEAARARMRQAERSSPAPPMSPISSTI